MTDRPTAGEVRRVLDYDPETGVFRWRQRADVSAYWNRRFAGQVAGYVNAPGEYRRIVWKGWRPFPASHLAWVIIYGAWPPKELDHQNLDRDDNRITNLRIATRSQNSWNKRAYSNSSSGGIKGVSFNKKARKWEASIRVFGRPFYLGFFDNKDDAAIAYAEAAKSYHGEFARVA
jgi:hypothetical protein